jgi:hypothetical protein
MSDKIIYVEINTITTNLGQYKNIIKDLPKPKNIISPWK